MKINFNKCNKIIKKYKNLNLCLSKRKKKIKNKIQKEQQRN